MNYITYEESIIYGSGLSYIEYVIDTMISFFLNNRDENITADHIMFLACDDVEETINHLERILHIVKRLVLNLPVDKFEVWYENGDKYPDIFDGWHRIRAYQYLGYKKIPCIIINV